MSFVDPRFNILDLDSSNDDEPHSNILRGDAFLAQTFKAVARSRAWRNTVFIITFDEWGGFFDNVAPPRVVAPVDPTIYIDQDQDTDRRVLLGFRVPTVVASPWTRTSQTYVSDSAVYDHTSILKLIEWRWSLPPLTARDAASEISNLADVLDFGNFNWRVPHLPSPPAPAPSPCSLQGLSPSAQPKTEVQTTSPWSQLANSSLLDGWPVKRYPGARSH